MTKFPSEPLTADQLLPGCEECEIFERDKHDYRCRLHPDYDPTPQCIFHGDGPCSCGDKRLVFD